MSDDNPVTLIQNLQSQLAFQEDALAALNDALSQQQQDILLLRRQVALLKSQQDEQAAALAELPGGDPSNERPPHY
ncbi:MAG: SlyX family protein [Parahaliea sp.]